jgi:hypothetical protein
MSLRFRPVLTELESRANPSDTPWPPTENPWPPCPIDVPIELELWLMLPNGEPLVTIPDIIEDQWDDIHDLNEIYLLPDGTPFSFPPNFPFKPPPSTGQN